VIGAVLRWLPLSLAIHAAALATTLLLPRERAPLPLFVDLTLSPQPVVRTAASGAAIAARDAAAPPRRQPTASGPRAAGHARASDDATPPSAARPSPAVSEPVGGAPTAAGPEPASPTAAPAPSTEPPVAAAPSPAASSPVVAASAPDGGASEPAAATGAGGDGVAASPVAGSGAPDDAGAGARGSDADRAAARGAAGAGGETLALAIPGDDGGAYAGYISLLRRRVQEALTYPAAARRRGMSGTVHLDISVEPTGRIADVLVVRSSSHEMLDAAALDAVRRLRHVPFPAGVRPRPVRVRLPVVFELR
jgi:protein TonB